MKVLVTGASGHIGSAVAREFLKHDYEVRVVDKNPLPEDLRGRVEMVYAQITDRLAMLKAVEGCDKIAHLAAIPNPIRSEDQLMEVNVVGTQNVLAAAEANGIKNVCLASSGCAFGMVFAKHPFDPQYFPMDEKHSDAPQDLYGLSKLLNELTAATYTRRSGMATVCLRITTVMSFDDNHHSRWRRRNLEHGGNWKNREMWTYVDLRDCARAFRLGVENVQEGHHVLLLAARDAYSPHDVRELVRHHYPHLAHQVEHLNPTDGLYDVSLAEKTIGWVAEHSWRDMPELRDIQAEPLESK
jgi:nucleoside-diphosphate-sugar epimerase